MWLSVSYLKGVIKIMSVRRLDAKELIDVWAHSSYPGLPCEMCGRHVFAHYWARFDNDGFIVDCNNSSIPLWTRGNTMNVPNDYLRCYIVEEDWTYHTITVDSRKYEFFRNVKTDEIKAPGVVTFTTKSLADAESILYSIYER